MDAAEWEAQRRARLESDAGAEDAVAMRLRRAEEDKLRKLREFEEKARERSDEMGAREAALRERQASADLAKQQALQQLHEMNRTKAAAYNQGTCVRRVPRPATSPRIASSRFLTLRNVSEVGDVYPFHTSLPVFRRELKTVLFRSSFPDAI